MSNQKFYTWIDVQDALTTHFSTDANQIELKAILLRTYWDGLHILHTTARTETEIIQKLSSIFWAQLKNTGTQLYLSLENEQKLPILFELVEQEDINHFRFQPSLARKSFITQKNYPNTIRKLFYKPAFFAFHSFKGGVGRTLHSIAFALQLAEKHKVLLIDADFEAPGITWLIKKPEIAFADFLAMIHGTVQSKRAQVIEYTANLLKDNALQQNNLFVLPAFRNLDEQTASVLEIKPEHISKYAEDPFILSNLMVQLGQILKVDYIIMDLRAGISELSTGWLLDPAIYKVFTTTLSSQSLLGTGMMFRILSKFQQENHLNNQKPFVLITQIPRIAFKAIKNEWLSTIEMDSGIKQLRNSYIESFIDTKSLNDANQEVIIDQTLESMALFTEEYDTLKALPDNWEGVCKSIVEVQLSKKMAPLTDLIPNFTESNLDFAQSRQKLIDFSKNMIYAEDENIDNFLITEPIRRLAETYRSRVPITVIVGAKGAGKTFLFKQMAHLKNWKAFLTKVKGQSSNNTAFTFAVTVPLNMRENSAFTQIPKDIQAITHSKESNIFIKFIKPAIEKSLESAFTVSEWRNKWLDYMAWAAGFEVGEKDAGTHFIAFLEQKKIRMVGILDGLEDIFNAFNDNQYQQQALQALLQDVCIWLESNDKYLGILIFIRHDLISAAIPQNAGQFLSKYKDFELKWNSEEIFRLIHWILLEATVFKPPLLLSEELSQKKEDELIPALHKLWGVKMGSNDSNESLTYNWVLGSLANLNKEAQSRDMVRFLWEAAQLSQKDAQNSVYRSDRILFPSNMRVAMDNIAPAKLQEVKMENKPLKAILDVLETHKTTLKFPCQTDDLKFLNENQIKVLVDNGVIKLYKNEYYMAEIFRKGMGFSYSRKGKPKVLYY